MKTAILTVIISASRDNFGEYSTFQGPTFGEEDSMAAPFGDT